MSNNYKINRLQGLTGSWQVSVPPSLSSSAQPIKFPNLADKDELEDIDAWITKAFNSLTPSCDCGAKAVGTTHAHWCSISWDNHK